MISELKDLLYAINLIGILKNVFLTFFIVKLIIEIASELIEIIIYEEEPPKKETD